MHAVRLAGALENCQIGKRVKLMVGNPSALGDKAGALSLRDCYRTAKAADLSATIEPTLEFLQSQEITQTDQIGYSFGADKALTAIGRSEDYDQSVATGVIVEPVTAVERGFFELSKTFGSTRQHQRDYIESCQSDPYMEFWDQDNVWKALAFAGGMLRVSNIAIAKALTRNKFNERATRALETQPDAHIEFAWGTESELAIDAPLSKETAALQAQYPDRVTTHRLEGMYHAGVDDIDLFAAMMLQGLTRGAPTVY
jgi:hypothetical protein